MPVRRVSRFLCWGLAAVACSAALADPPREPRAIWKEVRVDFTYFGRTSRYSCEGLRGKLQSLLGQLGARRDLRLIATGCEEFGARPRGGSTPPGARLIFSVPAFADAAPKPLRSGDLAPVDAHYEPFTITVDAFRNMGVGDCEVVEDFVRQVLPKFTIRNLRQDIRCVPYQLSGSRYWVHGEILKAGPAAA